jgi:hypothetical protein
LLVRQDRSPAASGEDRRHAHETSGTEDDIRLELAHNPTGREYAARNVDCVANRLQIEVAPKLAGRDGRERDALVTCDIGLDPFVPADPLRIERDSTRAQLPNNRDGRQDVTARTPGGDNESKRSFLCHPSLLCDPIQPDRQV